HRPSQCSAFTRRRAAAPTLPCYLPEPRSDVHSVAINVATAMYHIANVNTNLKLDASIRRDIGVAFGQRSLDFNRALRCFQRTPEFNQERVTNGFYFSAVKPRKDFPKQPAMFL